jgi:hypothetical protein
MTFITNGALNIEEHRTVLIERKEFEKLVNHIGEKDLYIALHNPRQTGKTTMLFLLQDRLQKMGYGVAYIDLEGRDDLNKAEFYEAIANEILQGLDGIIEASLEDLRQMPQARGQDSFTEFLKWLSKHSPRAPKLIIIFDEVGGVPDETGKTFFSNLRKFHQAGRNNSKKDRDLYKKIMFIFAGALDLRRLTTGKNSPLRNVCTPFDLGDFTHEEVRLLARNLRELPVTHIEQIADSIYEWANGHPYLTQTLCALADECEDCRTIKIDELSELVKQLVETHILYGEDINLIHILKYLREEAQYRTPVFYVLKNSKNNPRKTVARMEELFSIGILKRGANAFLAVRNKIYSERLSLFFDDEHPAA